MCRLSDFLQQSYLEVHLSRQQDEPVLHQVMPSATLSASGVMRGHYLSALCSLPLLGGPAQSFPPFFSGGRPKLLKLLKEQTNRQTANKMRLFF
jgi:hypothetical protein